MGRRHSSDGRDSRRCHLFVGASPLPPASDGTTGHTTWNRFGSTVHCDPQQRARRATDETAMIVPAVISLMTSCLIRWKYRTRSARATCNASRRSPIVAFYWTARTHCDCTVHNLSVAGSHLTPDRFRRSGVPPAGTEGMVSAGEKSLPHNVYTKLIPH